MVRFSFWRGVSVRGAVCGRAVFSRALYRRRFHWTSGAAASVRHDADSAGTGCRVRYS